MRQTTATEKIDPLMRIQEEIKEVKRREQEYRQLKLAAGGAAFAEFDELDGAANTNNNDSNSNNEHLSMSPEPVGGGQVATVVTSLAVPDDSSLSSSLNGKESLDGHHSDDSGISGASSPVHGSSAHEQPKAPAAAREQRYIGPNAYNLTPVPPPQKLLTRAVSTPQIFTQNRIIAHSPAQKGLMQRFIASRGKIVLNSNSLNGGNKAFFGGGGSSSNGLHLSNGHSPGTPPNTPLTAAINPVLAPDFGGGVGGRGPASALLIPTVTMTPPVIERDAEGKPIRRGYIPVEVKIQRELKDYKTRESELKKYRRMRESTPDLLDSIDMENMESDEDDSEVEHCYGPGQLRSAKSIGELCDSAQSSSISPRTTPSPDFESKFSRVGGGASAGGSSGGMRPAMSLAQLCDLPPEEAPSSHRLIAQWESLIKKNEQRE